MKLFTKGLAAAVVAACMLSNIFAVGSKEELLARVKSASNTKPCMFFESFGKYPHAIVVYPRKNEVRDILFACEREGSVDFVGSPEDFANLVPAKLRVSWPLLDIYTEKKFKGFVVDKPVMKAISSKNYESSFKKPFIVSEYESGMDMKWVLGSAEQFQAFKNYFLKNVQTPADKKPFLVLEIEKNEEALTEEDAAFLDQYFDLADLSNVESQIHAEKLDSTIKQAVQDAHDYSEHQVGKDFMDLVRDDLFDDNKDGFSGFDLKKMGIRAAKYMVIGCTVLLLAKIAQERILDPLKTAIIDPGLNHIPGLPKPAVKSK